MAMLSSTQGPHGLLHNADSQMQSKAWPFTCMRAVRQAAAASRASFVLPCSASMDTRLSDSWEAFGNGHVRLSAPNPCQ